MKCPKCKTKNVPGSQFCGVCRYDLKVSHVKDIIIAIIAFSVIVLTVQVFATTLIAILEIMLNYKLADGESQLFGSITQSGTAEAHEIDAQQIIILLTLSLFSTTIVTRSCSTFVSSQYAKIIISPLGWLVSLGIHWYRYYDFYHGFLFKIITDLDMYFYAIVGTFVLIGLISIALKLHRGPRKSSMTRKNIAALFLITFLFIDFVYIPSVIGEDLKKSHEVYVKILKTEEDMRAELNTNYDVVANIYLQYNSIPIFNNSSEGLIELQKILDANNVSLTLINIVLSDFADQIEHLADKANMSELDIFYVELSGDKSIYTLIGMVEIGIEIGSTLKGIADYAQFLGDLNLADLNISIDQYIAGVRSDAGAVRDNADEVYSEFIDLKNKNVTLLDDFLEKAIAYLEDQKAAMDAAWVNENYYEVALRGYITEELADKLSIFYDSATSTNGSISDLFNRD